MDLDLKPTLGAFHGIKLLLELNFDAFQLFFGFIVGKTVDQDGSE